MLYDIHFQAQPGEAVDLDSLPTSEELSHTLELALKDQGLSPTVSQINRTEQDEASPEFVYINGQPVSVRLLANIYKKLTERWPGIEIPADANVTVGEHVKTSYHTEDNPYVGASMGTGHIWNDDLVHVWFDGPDGEIIDVTAGYMEWLNRQPHHRTLTVEWEMEK